MEKGKVKSRKLVNTPKADGVITPINYMRNEHGRIDLEAYFGLEGIINLNGLEVIVTITDARTRYGHLDLRVTPKAGDGQVWVERKNIVIPLDESNKIDAAPSKKEMMFDGATPQFPESTVNVDSLRQMIMSIVAEQNRVTKA